MFGTILYYGTLKKQYKLKICKMIFRMLPMEFCRILLSVLTVNDRSELLNQNYSFIKVFRYHYLENVMTVVL